MKVLIVDDEKDTVDTVKLLLETSGFKVHTACCGGEGLKALEKTKANVVLLDIMMPDMSGWDVYSKIRKKDEKTKVIFLSALDVSSDRVEILKKHGVSDYIVKPFDSDDLIKRINAVKDM